MRLHWIIYTELLKCLERRRRRRRRRRTRSSYK